jgi:iron-sulfur cluster insertion protein
MTQLIFTPSAIQKITMLISAESVLPFFRVTVLSGGCSGFQYEFTLDHKKNSDDIVFDLEENIVALTDPISLDLLKDGIVDYHEDLASSQFVIRNPNASSSCGCGHSFSI